MAHITQEDKKRLAPQIKAVLKKYKIKATISVQHYMKLNVNIKSGVLDFFADSTIYESDRGHMSINEYYIDEHHTGDIRDFLLELKDAMNGVGTDEENYNNDDIQSDYFDRGWYISINIGKYDKPYILEA